jgi:branched-chain amino acid transport system substrate-binding protein
MKRKFMLISGVILLILLFLGLNNYNTVQNDSINIGFIGALTGPVAKYGSYEAVNLAVEEINANGGINGKKINMIYEDGACDPTKAAIAANKLINADNVKIILGGHCSSESLAIAPIIEENKILMLASITTNPFLTDKGDYVFRTSPISTVQSKIVADYAYNELDLRNMAIIYEKTDYAGPIAERLKKEFSLNGGNIEVFEGFTKDNTDFSAILSKIKNADSIFISVQSPDASMIIVKQLKEMNLDLQIFGNAAAISSYNVNEMPNLYEGAILAQPNYDESKENTKAFVQNYTKRYNVEVIPYGIWTAESYDAVYLIAEGIKQYGEDIEKLKEYLYSVKNYNGVSGNITIDEFGDGVREFVLMEIKNGKQVPMN